MSFGFGDGNAGGKGSNIKVKGSNTKAKGKPAPEDQRRNLCTIVHHQNIYIKVNPGPMWTRAFENCGGLGFYIKVNKGLYHLGERRKQYESERPQY